MQTQTVHLAGQDHLLLQVHCWIHWKACPPLMMIPMMPRPRLTRRRALGRALETTRCCRCHQIRQPAPVLTHQSALQMRIPPLGPPSERWLTQTPPLLEPPPVPVADQRPPRTRRHQLLLLLQEEQAEAD